MEFLLFIFIVLIVSSTNKSKKGVKKASENAKTSKPAVKTIPRSIAVEEQGPKGMAPTANQLPKRTDRELNMLLDRVQTLKAKMGSAVAVKFLKDETGMTIAEGIEIVNNL